MTLALEWSGQHAFGSKPLREWTVSGHAAGRTRNEGFLTFATIYGAGHLVRIQSCQLFRRRPHRLWKAPYDKPEEALELVAKWLDQEEL